MSSPPPVFTDLSVAASHIETHELTLVRLSGATSEFLAAYKTPGQYVQVKTAGLKPGFFAIASGPGRHDIELLIKRGSPTADAIISAPIGGKVEVSHPAGNGYPLEQARGHNLFLVGVGSGIAPLRAVVHAILKDRDAFGAVTLIYGARTSSAFPFSAEMEAWQAHKIDVVRVCSQPAHGTWPGPVGRVQDALRANHAQVDPRSAAFVCGMKAMVEDVKAAFGCLGLPPERVFQNF